MRTTLKIAFMTLVAGLMATGAMPVRADQPVDSWSVRGLMRPGAWFEKYNAEKPVTVAVSKFQAGCWGADTDSV
jgi:hypothetical protein